MNKVAIPKWRAMFSQMSAPNKERLAQSAGMPLAPFQQALQHPPQLSNARRTMSSWNVPDANIQRRAASVRQSAKRGGPVELTNEGDWMDSFALPGSREVIVGTKGLKPGNVADDSRLMIASQHELGEVLGSDNLRTRAWGGKERIGEMMKAKRDIPDPDLHQHIKQQMANPNALMTPRLRHDLPLNTPISSHATATPLAMEYAAAHGNPTAMGVLRDARSGTGEGVQEKIFRQHGLVNPFHAQKAYKMSPSKDYRMTEQIRNQYDQRIPNGQQR